MRTLSLLSILLISLGCASQGHKFPPGTVSHVVVCYLKKSGDAADRQKLIDTSRQFRQIPGVLSVEVGKVLPSTRPIVVNDYDVALVITFKDAAALEAYGPHPLHQQAIKDVLTPLTSKVLVYDFINE